MGDRTGDPQVTRYVLASSTLSRRSRCAPQYRCASSASAWARRVALLCLDNQVEDFRAQMQWAPVRKPVLREEGARRTVQVVLNGHARVPATHLSPRSTAVDSGSPGCATGSWPGYAHAGGP